MRLFLFFILSTSLLFADGLDSLIQEAKKIEGSHSIPKISLVREKLETFSKQNPSSKSIYWFARITLAQANVERFLRRELPEAEGKSISRTGTAQMAQNAIDTITPFLEKEPWSEGFRVRGELYSHTIVGMMTGFSNGPKALADVLAAIKADEKNHFAHTAQAKMFYYNPPISGGDVDKAIKTCKKSLRLQEDDSTLTLLGRSYIKKERAERAGIYLRKALKINPENIIAQHFLNLITEGK